MKLSSPPAQYDRRDQAAIRDEIAKADARNHKKGQDVEIAPGRLILTDRTTGARYSLEMISGALTPVALP